MKSLNLVPEADRSYFVAVIIDCLLNAIQNHLVERVSQKHWLDPVGLLECLRGISLIGLVEMRRPTKGG